MPPCTSRNIKDAPAKPTPTASEWNSPAKLQVIPSNLWNDKLVPTSESATTHALRCQEDAIDMLQPFAMRDDDSNPLVKSSVPLMALAGLISAVIISPIWILYP